MGLVSFLYNTVFVSLAVGIIYISSIAIYNITFHRLASFPGPMLNGAFEFPWHWHSAIRGDNPSWIKNLHDKYGDTVRVAPARLSFNTSQAWKDINGHKKGRKDLMRDPTIFFAPPGSSPNLILGTDSDHNRMRRVLGHAFSDGALREQEPLILNYCDLLIRRLKDEVKGPSKGIVDIVCWFNFTSFDIIGDLMFSESFQALQRGVYHKWMATVFQSLKVAPILISASAYPIANKLLSVLIKLVPAIKQAKLDHDNYTKVKVARRIESNTDQKDFMSHILRHNDEKGLTHGEVISNSAILILAGSETTATLLSGLTYLLLRNPDKLHKLQQEIRLAFQSTDQMTFAEVANLTYLQGCIQEGLRMYPPLPGATPCWTPPEGTTINGWFVPGNTSVGVHPLSAFRSSKNFRDPEKFAPERWLGDERYANDDRDAMLPFGLGYHNCIGYRLAYAEIRSVMCRLLWSFDIELCPGMEDWMNQKVFVIWDKPALEVKLTARI